MEEIKHYEIEQHIIDDLAKIYLNTFSKEENIFINEMIKYTLQYAQTENNSSEVGIMLDIVDWNHYDVVCGTYKSVKFNTDKMRKALDECNNQLILIHNHPSNKIFSDKDIFNFCKATAVNMLIVVGNKGSIYIVRKKEQFDKYKLIEYYSMETDKNKDKLPRNMIIEQTLKIYHDEIGIEFIKEENYE